MGTKSGFTLIEVLMIILVISVLAVASIAVVGTDINQARYDTTLKHMLQIRTAILGEEYGGPTGSRFGYLGDLGGYPSPAPAPDFVLSALVTNPAGVNPWTADSAAKIGAGWNGPYLPDHEIFGFDYSKDEWGNPFVYDSAADPITLTSYGADGSPGGTGLNSDIILVFPTSLSQATLHVLIQNAGRRWEGTGDLQVNYPDGTTGAIAQKLCSYPGKGEFQCESIPVGDRSLILYLPNKTSPAAVLGPFQIRVNRPQTLIILGTSANPLDLSASP